MHKHHVLCSHWSKLRYFLISSLVLQILSWRWWQVIPLSSLSWSLFCFLWKFHFVFVFPSQYHSWYGSCKSYTLHILVVHSVYIPDLFDTPFLASCVARMPWKKSGFLSTSLLRCSSRYYSSMLCFLYRCSAFVALLDSSVFISFSLSSISLAISALCLRALMLQADMFWVAGISPLVFQPFSYYLMKRVFLLLFCK